MVRKRKICVITGSRAEYGLLYLTMKAVKESSILELQIIVTGSHLSPSFGNTIKEIEQDGFKINHRLKILDKDNSSEGISKSMSKVFYKLPEYIKDLNPDLILVLGDRYEIFSSVASATVLNVPIAHIHGGEITQGAYDEAFRHSISKMAHLHLTSTEAYRRRVIQLGENPKSVFCVGSPGVERIKTLKLLSKKDTEDLLGIKFNKNNFLITIHPETLNQELSSRSQLDNLLKVLNELRDTSLIFTKSNSDAGGRLINETLKSFVSKDNTSRVLHSSLGQINYISVMKFVDAVIGNSSSGLIEAPALGLATINIGDRQKGRVRPDSVIDADSSTKSLRKSLEVLSKEKFKKKLISLKNPYDGGTTSKKIVKILETYPLSNVLKKRFYDN